MLWKGFSLPWEDHRSATTVVLWTSRLFYVSELTSAFFFPQNVPNCWFGHSECPCYLSNGFVLFLKSHNCLFHLYWKILWLHDVGSQQQLPKQMTHLESSPDLLLLNRCNHNQRLAHACPWNSFWVNCPITYGPLKKGDVHLHLADAFTQSDLQCIQAIHFSFISICVPWESNPQPFELLTLTTEPQEHCTYCTYTY